MKKALTYLDANAGVPLKPAVKAALQAHLDQAPLFNASSIHAAGRSAKRLLAEARERVTHTLGQNTDSEQLVFTSSGTEANQLVIRSVFEKELLLSSASAGSGKLHWITSELEHDSNRQMQQWLVERGGRVSCLPTLATGEIDLEPLTELLQADTALISLVWGNNETGVLLDLERLAQLLGKLQAVLVHLDGVQIWGKREIHFEDLPAHFLTLSGHKIGALAGVGAVYVRPGTRLSGLLLGKQEKGRRGGSENLLGVLSMGVAAQRLTPQSWSDSVEGLRDRFERELSGKIAGVRINGRGAPRIANTSNVSFEGIQGEGLVLALDLSGFCVSAGSACASGALEPSHVLMAMGRTRDEAAASLRISLVDAVAWEVLQELIVELDKIVSRMRGVSKCYNRTIKNES